MAGPMAVQASGIICFDLAGPRDASGSRTTRSAAVSAPPTHPPPPPPPSAPAQTMTPASKKQAAGGVGSRRTRSGQLSRQVTLSPALLAPQASLYV
ncbi:unnamed protein product [Protopolystoma xenopodis]|uniref:Uncharacterized protein n=1 Tax=Protopolystoma xenopodis TaxID=117903 RepID=A0A3S5B073_9PLAT|nr:unnamed protein product [Protopolystoma xenopodis]